MPGSQADEEPGSIESRAVRGVALLVGRTLALQALTIAGTIVLSRLVGPAAYGLFAIAIAVQQLGRSASELGLAAALVAREKPPSATELQSVGCFAMLSAATLAMVLGIIVAIAAALGLPLLAVTVIAIAGLALPLYSLRLAPIVLLERGLRFREIVVMEVVETLAFYAFAVPAASQGLGAFALAAAVPVAALLGTVVIWVLAPAPAPTRLRLAVVRPLLAFGVRVSLLTPLQLGRELGTTVALAAIGGPATAGYYNLSVRLLSLLTALSYGLQRVALPALARVSAGNPRRERSAAAATLSVVAASLPVSLITGAAIPLVAVLFGSRWLPAVNTLSASALGVLVFTSIGAIEIALSLADDDARRPLRAFLAYALIQIGVAVGLTSWLGATAAGVAVTAGSLAFAGTMLWPLGHTQRHIALGAVRVAMVTVIAVAAGRVASDGGEGVAALIRGLVASGAAWLVLSLLLNASATWRLADVLRRYVLRSTSV